ncbi:MarR family transcriptional regulator [Paenibacillus sp. CAA11]|uniref:MarR family winged helix-turn-helix transcriptional regulator n=1 Tax=Paenibacillus sp. CAA11 TaxID=1532905 RepID=UPI000D36B596|nr:MarR family transcriptional regulator [Paenibacillus sp. CAA11]AWB44281.1 MarR family transcriptional regulator [Paenibacillus sp. CAA11]
MKTNEKEGLLKLENQLCFTIYACSREITKLYQPHLEKLGVTYSQYLVLLVLWERGECTVKELGEALYLDSGTLTPLLKRLQSAGILNRERSPHDERKVLITLTEKGKELREQALSVPEAVFGGVCGSPEEFDLIMRQFKDLLNHVHSRNLAKS